MCAMIMHADVFHLPEVGSSMKMTDGLAHSSTPMVNRFLCSTDSPLCPGTPTSAPANGPNSISSVTYSNAAL